MELRSNSNFYVSKLDWQVLVTLFCYNRLSGYNPFNAQTRSQLIYDIQNLLINTQCNNVMSNLSLDCHDIIFNGLLVVDSR